MGGGSPPPFVAYPKVDPRLDSRGGTMHVQNRCRGAVGDCRRKLGLFRPSGGVGRPHSEAVWAHIWLVFSLWDPYVDNGVHGVKLSWHVMWAY